MAVDPAAASRPASIESCFDYDAVARLVAWNDPDDEHTRFQLRRCLDDLVETAIREKNDEAERA